MLLDWLTRELTRIGADAIEKTLPQLDPTVRDFVTWNLLPPDGTLPAIRRSSPLSDWLELLPHLARTWIELALFPNQMF